MLLDLSCLSYPLPPDVRRLYEAGDFGLSLIHILDVDKPRNLAKSVTVE